MKNQVQFHTRGAESLARRHLALRRAQYHVIPGSTRRVDVGASPHYFGRAARIRTHGWAAILDGLRFGLLTVLALRAARDVPSRGTLIVLRRRVDRAA